MRRVHVTIVACVVRLGSLVFTEGKTAIERKVRQVTGLLRLSSTRREKIFMQRRKINQSTRKMH